MRTSFVCCLALVVALSVIVRPVSAAPEVRYLFPPGGERGRTALVTAAGKLPKWPVTCSVDRPGLMIQPQEKSGVLSVTIAADAAPGIYWIRLSDDNGGAAPQPFVVGTLPEIVEAEPNDALAAVQSTGSDSAPTQAVVVNGRLNKGGDVDLYAISAEVGQTLVADVDANALLASPIDCVLQLVSPAGFVYAQNDDQLGLDPRLAVKVPESGIWRVRVFGFPAVADQSIGLAGNDSFLYRLTLSTGPVVDYTLPLALARDGSQSVELHGWNLPAELSRLNVTSSAASEYGLEHAGLSGMLRVPIVEHSSVVTLPTDSDHATNGASARNINLPIVLPTSVTGRIATRRQRDTFKFSAKQGEILVAKVESRTLGFELDPVLELLDGSGKQLVRVDDIGESRDAELTHAAPADGEYQLIVSDLHSGAGERFVYCLTAQRGLPDFALTLDAHQLIVAPGATVELQVNVDRRHGHNEPISVTIEGLPEGVTIEPVVSRGDDDSAKKVTLKLTATTAAATISKLLRITGRVGEQPPRTALVNLGAHGPRPVDLWLTVSAAEAKP